MSHKKLVAGIKYKTVTFNYNHANYLFGVDESPMEFDSSTKEIMRKHTVDNQETACRVAADILQELWKKLGVKVESSTMRMTNREWAAMVIAQQRDQRINLVGMPESIKITDEIMSEFFSHVPEEIITLATKGKTEVARLQAIGMVVMEALYNAYDAVISRYISSGTDGGNYRPKVEVEYSITPDILTVVVRDNGAGKECHKSYEKKKINNGLKLFIGENGAAFRFDLLERLKWIGHNSSAMRIDTDESPTTFILNIDLNRALKTVGN